MLRNVRLKVFVNGGEVTIDLKPGQTVSHENFEYTDEGWSGDSTSWTYDAEEGCIVRAYETSGRDCDGYMTTRGEDWCLLADARADVREIYTGKRVEVEEDGDVWMESERARSEGWPIWQGGIHTQRDFTAESMNY